jgi:PAS domain S-box-containing protein
MIAELKDDTIFKRIFEFSIEGILVINENGYIIKANPAIEQMFGYNTGELLEKKVETIIPNKFQLKTDSHKTTYPKKTIKNCTKICSAMCSVICLDEDLAEFGLKKDGSKFPLEISLTPTKTNNKRVTLAFVIDITKRIFTNKKRIESERIMTETQRLAHVGNWCWNLKTNKRKWSDEFYRICGLTPGDEHLNSETFINFIHPEDRESTIKTVNNAIEKLIPYKYNKRILRQDGTIRYIIAKGEISFNKKNEPVRMYGTMQDITKHIEIENELKNSKKRNQDILETLPDLMILYDKHGNILEFHNPEKVTTEKNIGKNINKILPQKVCKRIREGFAECEKTKKTQIIEYSLIIKDKLVHRESRISQTDQGYFLSIIRNITESKNSAKIIKENEQRLKLTLEAGEFGSWDWNLISNEIVRDNYLNSLFGRKVEEVTTTYKSFLKKIHPEDRENVKTTILEAIESRTNYTLEYRIILADSSIRWLHEKGNVYKNKHGIPVRIIGVTNSITKQKKAEEKLKESEEKLRNYTKELEEKVTERTKELTTTVQKLVTSNLNLEDQILITKEAEIIATGTKQLIANITKNFPKGFVTVVDSSFKIIFIDGEEFEEIRFKDYPNKGITFDEVKSLLEDVKIKNKIQKSLEGQHCSFEVKFEDRTYLVNTTPLYDINKKLTQVLLVYNNITNQKQAELKILNTLKAEQELGELKSRFISMASHEFRTPLSAILSSAILIEKQNETGKEDRRLRHISKIRSNVNNLVIILNDFLSLSKLDEGRVILKPSKFNIIDFSKSMIEEIQDIKKDGQTINFIHNQLTTEVFLDQKLLKHITYNLLSNAIKYSEKNKEITYKIESSHSLLQIVIIDKGIGIPIEDQNNIFQRFYRGNNAVNIEGTGLGLNIIKQYSELMGGNIKFKSRLNEGSTFYIEFPIN